MTMTIQEWQDQIQTRAENLARDWFTLTKQAASGGLDAAAYRVRIDLLYAEFDAEPALLLTASLLLQKAVGLEYLLILSADYLRHTASKRDDLIQVCPPLNDPKEIAALADLLRDVSNQMRGAPE